MYCYTTIKTQIIYLCIIWVLKITYFRKCSGRACLLSGGDCISAARTWARNQKCVMGLLLRRDQFWPGSHLATFSCTGSPCTGKLLAGTPPNSCLHNHRRQRWKHHQGNPHDGCQWRLDQGRKTENGSSWRRQGQPACVISPACHNGKSILAINRGGKSHNCQQHEHNRFFYRFLHGFSHKKTPQIDVWLYKTPGRSYHKHIIWEVKCYAMTDLMLFSTLTWLPMLHPAIISIGWWIHSQLPFTKNTIPQSCR